MLLSPPFIFILPFVIVSLPSVAKTPILFLENFSRVISGAWIFAPVFVFVYITPIDPSTVSVVLPVCVLSLPLLSILVVVLVWISVQFTPLVSFFPLPIWTLAIAWAGATFEIFPAIYTPREESE